MKICVQNWGKRISAGTLDRYFVKQQALPFSLKLILFECVVGRMLRIWNLLVHRWGKSRNLSPTKKTKFTFCALLVSWSATRSTTCVLPATCTEMFYFTLKNTHNTILCIVISSKVNCCIYMCYTGDHVYSRKGNLPLNTIFAVTHGGELLCFQICLLLGSVKFFLCVTQITTMINCIFQKLWMMQFIIVTQWNNPEAHNLPSIRGCQNDDHCGQR